MNISPIRLQEPRHLQGAFRHCENPHSDSLADEMEKPKAAWNGNYFACPKCGWRVFRRHLPVIGPFLSARYPMATDKWKCSGCPWKGKPDL